MDHSIPFQRISIIEKNCAHLPRNRNTQSCRLECQSGINLCLLSENPCTVVPIFSDLGLSIETPWTSESPLSARHNQVPELNKKEEHEKYSCTGRLDHIRM